MAQGKAILLFIFLMGLQLLSEMADSAPVQDESKELTRPKASMGGEVHHLTPIQRSETESPGHTNTRELSRRKRWCWYCTNEDKFYALLGFSAVTMALITSGGPIAYNAGLIGAAAVASQL